jgi:hypothetical protein
VCALFTRRNINMLADGYLVGDGSWNLRVYVTDLQVERTLRVKGDLHIGGVMLRLVEDLGKFIMQTQGWMHTNVEE